MKKLACFSKVPVLVLSFVLLTFSSMVYAEETYATFKIDNKVFKLKDVALEYNATDNFISLRAEKMETVVITTEEGEEETDMSVGMAFELDLKPKSPEGKYESSSPETIPVSFWWYDMDNDLNEFYISLDGGDESSRKFAITIDKFGEAGSMVSGSFQGVLLDESGKTYKITDGKFCAKRVDTE